MTHKAFACGETLCKNAFDAEVSSDRPWPIRCPACSRSLYPDDILQSSQLETLDPHRGPLMIVRAGKLVPVASRDLLAAAPPGKAASSSLLDEIADATVQAHAPPPKSGRTGVWIAVALAVIAAVVWAVLRR